MYDKKRNCWRQIGNLHNKRREAVCSVFEGKIVVTGGSTYNESSKSAESFARYEIK